jgi:hypothetical protein
MVTYYLLGRGWKVQTSRVGPEGHTEYAFDREAERELREYSIARSTLYAVQTEMRRALTQNRREGAA